MPKKLFLLDGMALVYRAHFALIGRPILTSKGVNTSALYGFGPGLCWKLSGTSSSTHLAAVFDTSAPTHREKEYAEYKAQRQAMPEDITAALPHVHKMLEAFRVPVLTCDGYEADDLIGTIVRRAEKEGFHSYMVTPDKDFGQLVSENTWLYNLGMGDGVEVLGVAEVLQKWGIQKVEQVIDILALWGDAVDNIPGVPGIGEKTSSKLIGQYGSVENLLAHTAELAGKVKTSLETHRDQALLSKRLATILCDAPCPIEFDQWQMREPHADQLKTLFVEFEFNSIGRRLFGDGFQAGRGFGQAPVPLPLLPMAARRTGPARRGWLARTAGRPARTRRRLSRGSEPGHRLR